jgi:hypothetical protein
MTNEDEKWIYAPVSDEAARKVAEIATSACGAQLCENIIKCHRECMILIGDLPEKWLIGNVRLQVSIWCDDPQCKISDNYGPDSTEQKEIIVPGNLVRPAMTLGERKRLMRGARLRYENGADEDTEMEIVRWY